MQLLMRKNLEKQQNVSTCFLMESKINNYKLQQEQKTFFINQGLLVAIECSLRRKCMKRYTKLKRCA